MKEGLNSPDNKYSLTSSKNWVMKWSVYTEKGKYTGEVAGKHKVILKFIYNYPKNIKV